MARKPNNAPQDGDDDKLRREYEEHMKALGKLYPPLKVRHQYTSGLLALDFFFNPKNPGIPGGTVVQMAGAGHSGKTGLALNMIKYHRANGFRTTYVDQENGLKEEYVEGFGWSMWDDPLFQYVMAVDPDEIHLQHEFTYQLLKTCKKNQEPHILVIDSMPAWKAKPCFETVRVGSNVQSVGQWCNAISPLLANSNALVILINRVTDDIGNMWNEFKIPGGHALHAISDITTLHRRLANPSNAGSTEVHSHQINNNFTITTRQKLGITIHKNKFTNSNPKFSKLDYFLNSDPRFGEYGLDNGNSMLAFLKDMGVLRSSGARYSIGETSMFWKQWERSVVSDPEVNELVVQKTQEALNKMFNDKLNLEE